MVNKSIICGPMRHGSPENVDLSRVQMDMLNHLRANLTCRPHLIFCVKAWMPRA